MENTPQPDSPYDRLVNGNWNAFKSEQLNQRFTYPQCLMNSANDYMNEPCNKFDQLEPPPTRILDTLLNLEIWILTVLEPGK